MQHRAHFQARHILVVLLVVLGMFAVSRLQADAEDATPVATAPVLPPDASVDGLSLGEWHARYVQWFASLLVPGVTTYDDDTGARCNYGQHGPVFFLDNAPASVERACNVPSDIVLFVPIFSYECSTAERDPELTDPAHADEAALRACAQTHIDVGIDRDFPLLSLTVYGVTVDLAKYRAPSPAVTIVWPPGNDLGIPAGVARSVIDGYAALVGPLDEGEHVVEFTTTNGDGGVVAITYRLTVSSDAPAN